jgi:3'-5' exoribonuclease
MSKPRKSAVMKLSEMQPGQFADCFVQLAEKKRGTTRENNPFITCKYRDARRTVGSVPIWGDAPLFEECQTWQIGQFFKVRGRLIEHERYGLQLEVEQIRPVEPRDEADGFSELEFLVQSRSDAEEVLAELVAFAGGEIADVPLRTLVLKLLTDNAGVLKRLPGSLRHYYRFVGGWLEHTVNVARNCALLADRYATSFPDLKPPLNRDLVVAGAILHDIGRVKDMEPEGSGLPLQRAVAGELFGHVILSHNMIASAAHDVPDLNPELLDLLLHIVLAHLKQPEWGSRLPCIPEVLILHHVDDLDAKFEMFARCLANDTSDGALTERDTSLNRPLLKKRTV